MTPEQASELGRTLDHLVLDIKLSYEILDTDSCNDYYEEVKPMREHIKSQIELRDIIKVKLDLYTRKLINSS